MTQHYISRTLIANRGRNDVRVITEADIGSIDAPVTILGDPGSGKTELTKALERQFGYRRISGGAFYRNQNIVDLRLLPNTRLIIDGLDEIASSSGVSAIDEILKKLSQIGRPRFVLSCRSADWQGSTDRHKIREDYEAEPVTLHLQPFTYEDAKAFLDSYSGSIDADDVLDGLDRHDLSEFYVNPLTLTLVAELVAAKEGLPKGRVDLLNRASELLTFESNPAHQRSTSAQSSLDKLLDSAGAAFSHLLLSGSIGLTDRPREQAPDGYVPIGEMAGIADASLIPAVVKTRLFQSPEENLYLPFHRVIGEYLGARWLSKQISGGFSERRAFQALTFAGGVPTAFRGLHAWLAHFSPRLALRCIRADPYGVLRYGEPDRLPLDQARLLLNSLATLANEDPYFRSEDWGRRAISGLARPELKDEVVNIIKRPDRHIHLSTLVLEALGGSPLTQVIADELLIVVRNAKAAYIERKHAAEALVESKVNIDWPALTGWLQARKEAGDKRLTLEIIALTRGEGFSGGQIADAIIGYRKSFHQSISDGSDDDEPYVSGMVYGIARRITPKKSGEILEQIISHIKKQKQPAHQRLGHELSYCVYQLVEKAIEANLTPAPERVWSWLQLTEDEREYSSERKRPIQDWLIQNPSLRREIQRTAFNDVSNNGDPWMAIVHYLPRANRALALSMADAGEFLAELGSKDTLDNFDVVLWAALIRSQQGPEGISAKIEIAAYMGINRHPILEQEWKAITSPPKLDWQKEEEKRREYRQHKQAREFEKHREHFLPIKEKIASGLELGALKQIASAYLGRYYNLNHEAQPDERVRQWLGNELASAALGGFVRALSRSDMPSAQQIAEIHVEGKEWNVEAVLVSGIAELVRSGGALTTISHHVLASALAAWWEFPEVNSNRLGEHIQERLEDLVFSSEQEIENFLCSVVEPRIRAGQQYVPALYRLAREDRFKFVAGKLALQWLVAYPKADSRVQLELLQIAIERAQSRDVRTVVRERLSKLHHEDIAAQRIWMSAAFLLDFDDLKESLAEFFSRDKNYLWGLREMVRPERHEHRALKSISIQQLEFIITTFADRWPPIPHPSGGWGDTHPWNATEFICSCIDALGADPSEGASISLGRIASAMIGRSYSNQINHARAQQLRLRRDTEFVVPTFNEVKQTLSNGLPGNIDDLKAMTMDRLELFQDYVRNSDTDSWEAFWNKHRPKNENTCRNLLLDQLRPRLPVEVNFLPEIAMPEANRADIVAIYRGYGVPVEIKGQWHPEVWNAASVQLIEKYARDWRAHDRGIYLVLWFGNVPGKNLPRHPESLARPSTPGELREMLGARLGSTERARIDIFVLDVSKPKRPKQKLSHRPSRAKSSAHRRR